MEQNFSDSVTDEQQTHRTLNAEILAGIPEDKLELAVLAYVKLQLEGRYAEEVRIVATLPVGVRSLYVTWGVTTEVINGGFSRYYRATASKLAHHAVAAFEFFGAHEHAAIMREANYIHAVEKAAPVKPKDPNRFESFFAPHEMSRLHALDYRFYKLEENMTALRVAKIRSDPESFTTRPLDADALT